MKIRIGSRESNLAVVQAKIVIDAIRKYDPSIETELITMKTTGDRILDRNLDQIGGKGLFIKELERALLDEEVDLTVHSMKDMPMDLMPELPILAVSGREDPRDVLVLPEGTSKGSDFWYEAAGFDAGSSLAAAAERIDFSKPVGCSSNRRMLQFAQMFPQARFEPIRGNVQTRLKKLDSGAYAATIMAAAGLKRAGLEHRISRYFTVDEMLPAACQGVLAVQGRRGFDVSFLQDFCDQKAWQEAACERSFVQALDGGCTSPVAAYAVSDGARIRLTGLNIDRAGKPFTASCEGPVEDARKLGRELAEEMRQ